MYVSRGQAIDRILKIDRLLADKEYQKIEDAGFEHDCSISDFVNDNEALNVSKDDLDKWTNTMLTDKMDDAFYRYSMFDNYLIEV